MYIPEKALALKLNWSSYFFWFIGVGFAFPEFAFSQASDSLLSYDLEEIVVSTGNEYEVESNTVFRVSIAEVESQNAKVVSDLAHLIPAAHVQTNSRGESLIYVRNAGERQVALFFNGALLNIPWDNRVNLDILPAGVIGNMTVAKGAPSVLYGTNALGGAISMTSRSIENEGSLTEVGGAYGLHASTNIGLTHLVKRGRWEFGIAGGYATRNGMPLPGEVDLPFSQSGSDTRTNTDRELINLFGQTAYTFTNGIKLGLSALFVDGSFGIAPESHLDPSVSRVRFWRYPEWKNTSLILNGVIPVGRTSAVKGALWGNWYRQQIDSYESVLYDLLEEQQSDLDNTFGTRFSWVGAVGSGELSLAVNSLVSEHEEVVYSLNEEGALMPENDAPVLFSQMLYSLGAEYGLNVTKYARINVGGSIDGMTAPKTGDKPSIDPFTDFGMNAGIRWRFSDQWMLRGATGRKVRFPTMRELFGVALNRFLLNPNLSPESSLVTEFGVSRTGSVFSGELIGFYHRTFDTIDQRNVEVDGRTLRERVNLEGSRVWGIESVFKARPYSFWDLSGHLTWMHPRAFQDGVDMFLTEKPEWLGALNVSYNKGAGVSYFGEIVYTGVAYGLSEENEFVELNSSVIINAKLAYRFFIGSTYIEAYSRVDNIFDTVALPQLGLPGAGRLLSSGVNVSF